MKLPRVPLAMLTVAACCAAAWWTFRSPEPTVQPSPGSAASIAPSTVATAIAPAVRNAEPMHSANTPQDAAAEAELENMAALFAAEPALIDALEDATGASDPQVRDDAEQFLNSIELPEPNPQSSAE